MTLRTSVTTTLAAMTLLIASGCAVTRDPTEKATAETLAAKVSGVKSVKNQIVVRP
jgi:osmotically-inducible protein OsmY